MAKATNPAMETATETRGSHIALNSTINEAAMAKVPSVLAFIRFPWACPLSQMCRRDRLNRGDLLSAPTPYQVTNVISGKEGLPNCRLMTGTPQRQQRQSTYYSIASLSAQKAKITVIGAKIKFSNRTPEARFPIVFRIR